MASRGGTVKRPVSKQTRNSVVQKSSGNVFADLGFDQDEAEHLRIRSALMATLRQVLQDRTTALAK
jgi:predicted XRE-type DNA-binding protein